MRVLLCGVLSGALLTSGLWWISLGETAWGCVMLLGVIPALGRALVIWADRRSE